MARRKEPRVAIALTGAANLASVRALCLKAGAEPEVTEDPEELLGAEFAVLPGVGSFGAAMDRLAARGLGEALRERVALGRPTMGICLGMQLMCRSSEESPGAEGIGIVPAEIGRFAPGLPLPQLGWNRVRPGPGVGDGPSFVREGWAYFANSYRLKSSPPGFAAATSRYGEDFAASLELWSDPEAGRPSLLACQFHPELSGQWGLELFSRWLHPQMEGTGRRNAAKGLGRPEPRNREGARVGRDAPGERGVREGLGALGGTALRIIPCLDVKGGRVVKGRRFKELVDSGDPVSLARRYEEEGADELALLDISATLEERRTALDSLRALREVLSIPVTVGGGVRCVADAERLLAAGADRVAVNSAAVRDPGLIAELAGRFGVQCVVLAIDARERPGSGSHEVVIEAGTRATGLDAAQWARKGAELGAGEILLTSIDRDGTGSGYDGKLIAAVSAAAPIPVVASGGAKAPEQFLEGARSGARALLAAGVFHCGELSIGELKRYLSGNGMEVRI